HPRAFGEPSRISCVVHIGDGEFIDVTPEQVQDIARGGYVLKDAGGKPDLILIATGSEVATPWLAARFGWSVAFALSVVGMVITIINFAFCQKWVKQ
ncbi:hypothetical protein, partial [Klebsiella pneumoniae]|uniref:POT-type proton-dependent oligopeptide transporter n=1 Tax=Klebsiella pneumoniae TaxID=573 RepID=UPI0021B0D563